MNINDVVEVLHENNEIFENAAFDAQMAQGFESDLREKGSNFQAFVLECLLKKMTNRQKRLLRDFIYSSIQLTDDFWTRK